MIDPALRSRVEAWRDDDPDPDTVAELDRLLSDDDEAGLRDRFDRALEFGTAGLRGRVGAGPNRMNRAVVRRAAAGLVAWLDARATAGPVVVGRDARHGSAAFAEDTARVVAAAGREVMTFERPVPTPLVAFAARDLGAAAAVVVTASHNPAADNGYKVYGPEAAQIVPPADVEIAAEMDRIGSVAEVALAPTGRPGVRAVGDDVRDRYLAGVAALRRRPDLEGPVVAYTPMHGVGLDLVLAAFARAGLPAPHVVAAQADPDPDFPTVAFPNPEEPGAMDLVLGLAADVGADVVLANDPDADRLAVAVPSGDGFRVLTGDEVGVLLADHLLGHGSGPDRLVATTVVSSTMLARLAEAHGVAYVETLTGFKWLARAALDRPDLEFVLGYEEALGYSVGGLVLDKDGVSAAVVVAEIVAGLAADGRSVPERLDELSREHGVHLTAPWTNRFEGLDGARRMAERVERCRVDPPSELGGLPVDEVEDLAAGGRLPPTDAVVLRGPGLRVVVRPSGTEPKLKAYVEVVEPVHADLASARTEAQRLLDAVVADLDVLLR